MIKMLQRLKAWLDADKPERCNTAGWRSFQLGVFFLPTSALLAGVGLLGAISLWRPGGEPTPLRRPLARWLLILSAWMLITMLATPSSLEVRLRLANWLPFFWLLLAASPYLNGQSSRNRFGILVMIATVPAIAIGLLQAIFLFSGPWTAFGGLVNWDLPARDALQGTGVFPNPNFTAAWYAMVLPMAAADQMRWKPGTGRQIGSTIILIMLVLGLVISGSRNAQAAAIVGVLLLAWRRFWKPIAVLMTAQAAIVSAAFLQPPGSPLWTLAQRLTGNMASKIKPMLSGAGSNAADAIASGRYPYRSELFSQAFSFISHHPFLGLAEPLIGKAPVSSPSLVTHTHNVAFQLGIQHGLPAAMLLTGIIAWILIKGWEKRLTALKQPINQALLGSAVVTVFLHAYDIPSFDSRINMLGWLVISACWAATRETERRV
jgi:hypothetical protein